MHAESRINGTSQRLEWTSERERKKEKKREEEKKEEEGGEKERKSGDKIYVALRFRFCSSFRSVHAFTAAKCLLEWCVRIDVAAMPSIPRTHNVWCRLRLCRFFSLFFFISSSKKYFACVCGSMFALTPLTLTHTHTCSHPCHLHSKPVRALGCD